MDKLTLIKNPKGRVVSVSPERKKYLLDPNPVALKVNGQPKEDNNGNKIPLIKAEYERGWLDVTQAEYDDFVDEMESGQDDAQEAEDAVRAATLATATAAQLSAKAGGSTAKKTAGRKSNAQKAAEAKLKEELEASVRDAEDDAEKYAALSDDGKAMYLELFGDAPEEAKA